jgi:hypothetical protein
MAARVDSVYQSHYSYLKRGCVQAKGMVCTKEKRMVDKVE